MLLFLDDHPPDGGVREALLRCLFHRVRREMATTDLDASRLRAAENQSLFRDMNERKRLERLKNAMTALRRKMVSNSCRGVWPKRCRMLNAMRVLSPDFIKQAARMNAPRMKNTASLPNSAYA